MYQADQFVLKIASLTRLDGVAKPMTRDVQDAAARAVAQFCEKFHKAEALIVFDDEHGAAGAEWLISAVEAFRRHAPPGCAVRFRLQCSATALTESLLELCAGLPVEVQARLERVEQLKVPLRETSVVVCCVNPGEDGAETYRGLRAMGAKTLDLALPELVNWDQPPQGIQDDTPYAAFLKSMFDEWWRENDPSVRIRFFDGILRSLLGSRKHASAIGGDALHTLTIDPVGRIGLADGLRNCGNGFRHLNLNVHLDSLTRAFQQPAFLAAQAGQETLCEDCRRCPVVDVCGGGHLPWRFSQAREFDNASVYCRDLRAVVEHVAVGCAQASGG